MVLEVEVRNSACQIMQTNRIGMLQKWVLISVDFWRRHSSISPFVICGVVNDITLAPTARHVPNNYSQYAEHNVFKFVQCFMACKVINILHMLTTYNAHPYTRLAAPTNCYSCRCIASCVRYATIHSPTLCKPECCVQFYAHVRETHAFWVCNDFVRKSSAAALVGILN